MIIALVITTLIIPVMMIIIGLIFNHKPPKVINSMNGYRSKLSMKNQDTWDYANRYMGEVWFKLGIAMSIISLALTFLYIGKDKDTQGWILFAFTMVQLAMMLSTIVVIELKLRKVFDKDGNRK